jgi:transposase
MLTLSPLVRIFLCQQSVDLRKSFDGLSGCVETIIGVSPLSGHLFVFFNRRRTQVRILFWDRSGFCIYSKRLEQGCFSLSTAPTGATSVNLSMPELLLILEGIDLKGSTRRKRYVLPENSLPISQ